MAEDTADTNRKSPRAAEPPGGGLMDHHAMQRASMLPVSGPASLDTLAASGGLEVPGGEPAASAAMAPPPDAPPQPVIIPGERELDTLTHREPGAIGGLFNGADIPPEPPPWVDEALVRDRAVEAGGALEEKERRDGRHS